MANYYSRKHFKSIRSKTQIYRTFPLETSAKQQEKSDSLDYNLGRMPQESTNVPNYQEMSTASRSYKDSKVCRACFASFSSLSKTTMQQSAVLCAGKWLENWPMLLGPELELKNTYRVISQNTTSQDKWVLIIGRSVRFAEQHFSLKDCRETGV